jgi:hypothetical protein
VMVSEWKKRSENGGPGWNFVGAPFMPEEALILFPPGLRERSRRVTWIPLVTSVEAADKPANPDPTIIADFGSPDIFITEGFEMEGAFEDVRYRQRIDERAMKKEMEMSVRILLRDIEAHKTDNRSIYITAGP